MMGNKILKPYYIYYLWSRFLSNNPWLDGKIYPIGSMVLVYMLTYRGYIDGIHVAKYSIHGYYGIYKWWTLNCQAWLPDYRSTGKWVPIWKCANYSTTASVLINRKPHSSWPLDCCLGKAHSETKPGGVHDRNKPGNMSPL